MKFDTEKILYFKSDHIDIWTKLYTDSQLNKLAEDGQYVLQDDRVVTVKNGEVVFIKYNVNFISFKIINFSLFAIGIIIGVFITYLVLSL